MHSKDETYAATSDPGRSLEALASRGLPEATATVRLALVGWSRLADQRNLRPALPAQS
jgi:hypothetical protein